MPRSLDLYLKDSLNASQAITGYTKGKTFADYEADHVLRLAVERLFEIIGEALSQARTYYPEFKSRIQLEQRIIDFRHRVIHGYSDVNDEVVWSVVKVYLPPFLSEIRHLIAERTPTPL
jgi:uncharacterized protein with HEPN domain